MADHRATGDPADPASISPKVLWPLFIGVALTFVGVTLAAVTPETFEALGAWAVPVAIGVAAAGQAIVGYLKPDPARTGLVPPEDEPVTGPIDKLN